MKSKYKMLQLSAKGVVERVFQKASILRCNTEVHFEF